MIRFAWCMAVIAALLCPLPASAEIYKYVSASGEIVLVDYPIKAEELRARGLRLYGSEPSTPAQPQPVPVQTDAEREKQLQMDKIRAAEGAGIAVTSSQPEPTSFGYVKIDETLTRSGSTELHVTYTNNTPLTFTTSVEIRCQAFKDDKIVSGATTHISARDLGLITPGFEIKKVISVAHELVNPVDAIKCEVLAGN